MAFKFFSTVVKVLRDSSSYWISYVEKVDRRDFLSPSFPILDGVNGLIHTSPLSNKVQIIDTTKPFWAFNIQS